MNAAPARREFAKSAIDRTIRDTLDAYDRKPRRGFADLLWKVQGRSDLLSPHRFVGRTTDRRPELLVGGLMALFDDRSEWVRPADGWEPSGGTTLRLFSSLAHHLFADYPVPPVLLSSWFGGDDWLAYRGRRAFRLAGKGTSLREVHLPVDVSKRAAHEFAHAPAHLPFGYAVRWAQVRGFGGTDALAHAVGGSRLGRFFGGGEFWAGLIQMLAGAPRLNPDHARLIVDYVYERKFKEVRAIIGDGVEIRLDPPEPELTLRGRTVDALRRSAERWQAERPAGPEQARIRWEPSGLGGYRREGEAGVAWTVLELLDTDELAAEGKAMRHCAADYTRHCSRGESTVWSLGRESPGGRRRLATVEVDPKERRVVQAKARLNREPNAESLDLLRAWAAQENLTGLEPGEDSDA